jgi:hypothetical protein
MPVIRIGRARKLDVGLAGIHAWTGTGRWYVEGAGIGVVGTYSQWANNGTRWNVALFSGSNDVPTKLRVYVPKKQNDGINATVPGTYTVHWQGTFIGPGTRAEDYTAEFDVAAAPCWICIPVSSP